jgi:hypothetical protein
VHKCSAYIERLTPPLIEEEAALPNKYMSRNEKNLGNGSRGDLKPGITVLAGARRNLTD